MRRVLIVLVFVALLMTLAWRIPSDSPYVYDEADYMYAAKLGFVANYTDTPTMPIGEFLRAGLSRGRDSPQSSQLSELIRSTNDIVFYRHWHGPLYLYWLMLNSHLGLDEHGMRFHSLAFPISSLLVIYFGVLWLFPGMQGTLAAVIGSALFASSMTTVRSLELAPHQAFACCSLAGLILLSKTVATGNRQYFYMAVVVAALGCCLLEVGFVLLATLVLCGYLERRSLQADWGLAGRSSLLFAGTVLVVWPGAILKLSFVKGYLFMAYLALFRNSPWGSEGFIETWQKLFLSSPVEWLLIGVSLLIWMFSNSLKVERRVLYPFVLCATLMLIATLRVTTGTLRYALVFQPTLEVLAGCILAAYLGKQRPVAAYVVATTLALALFAETWTNLARRPVVSDPRPTALLAYIRKNHLERSRLLVPHDDLPTLHYYFPSARLSGYTDRPPALSELRDPNTDGIFYPGLPVLYKPVLPR